MIVDREGGLRRSAKLSGFSAAENTLADRDAALKQGRNQSSSCSSDYADLREQSPDRLVIVSVRSLGRQPVEMADFKTERAGRRFGGCQDVSAIARHFNRQVKMGEGFANSGDDATDSAQCLLSETSHGNKAAAAAVLDRTKVSDIQEGEVMSQKTIQMRAAEIRRSWSRGERKTRAAMGERRCLELLFQAGLVRPCFAAMRRSPA